MMTSPHELRKKAERLYLPFLKASLTNEPFFPKIIPCRKPNPTDDFDKLQHGIQQLVWHSKTTIGFGYTIEFQRSNTRRHGAQSLPHRIIFEDAGDFLKYLRKEREYTRFQNATRLLLENLPDIRDWLCNKPQQVLAYLDEWPDLIKVCRYFLSNPKPNLYPRELPVDVHTKFIEQHQAVLRSLLDFLLPRDSINSNESNFYKRFHLKYQEALIRFRFLDPQYHRDFRFHDVSIPESEFARADFSCSKVLVVENLMSFLTLPESDDTIAVWGKGFQVELLKHAEWLKNKTIFYWGDIDVQGFQILSQLRNSFPQINSLMMNVVTFNKFESFCIAGVPSSVQQLPNLTPEEKELLELVGKKNFRLEQEKIMHAHAVEVLKKFVK